METVEELIKFVKDGEDVNMKKKFLAVKGFDQASIGAILLAASLTVRVNRVTLIIQLAGSLVISIIINSLVKRCLILDSFWSIAV